MPNFSEYFFKAKGKPIQYKGVTLYLADDFPIKNGDVLLIKIEKTNSEWLQGLCIDISGKCEYDGKLFDRGKGVSMLFWEDTAPKEIKIKVLTKKSSVSVKNIWDKGDGCIGVLPF